MRRDDQNCWPGFERVLEYAGEDIGMMGHSKRILGDFEAVMMPMI